MSNEELDREARRKASKVIELVFELTGDKSMREGLNLVSYVWDLMFAQITLPLSQEEIDTHLEGRAKQSKKAIAVIQDLMRRKEKI